MMKPQISRRHLLKGSLATSIFATLLGRRSSQAAQPLAGYPESMGVLVDLTRCIGCRTCEAACNREQHLPQPENDFTDRSIFEPDEHGLQRRTDATCYTVVKQYHPPGSAHPLYRKVQCNHCNEPACLTSCFVQAYTKTPEGAVIYDPEVCVGCRTCMVACPFSIPAFRYASAWQPRIMKCVFCYDTRLKKRLPPACVEACPQEALTFGRRTDLLTIARQRVRRHPQRYIDHIYGEHEVGGTAWLYLSGVDFHQVGLDTSLPREPILAQVKDFLAIVPMVLTIWPALFAGFHLLANRKEHRAKTDPSGPEKE
jgi:formate dehydrogenase iron-sulfur subunit